MKGKVVTSLFAIALTITFIGFAGSALAQDKPADNMEIVKEKISTDKKLFIATNMQLTESEAKAFWPVYEAYQAEFGKLKDREIQLIGVLPDTKVARYYQLESKINAIFEYELARKIPLVQ